MQLDDFVKESIRQIVSGAAQANEELEKYDATVFPSYTEQEPGKAFYNDNRFVPPVAKIQFDVAVTSEQQSGKSGGLGIAILSAGIGAKVSDNSADSFVSRVSFEIPIIFPQNAIKKKT